MGAGLDLPVFVGLVGSFPFLVVQVAGAALARAGLDHGALIEYGHGIAQLSAGDDLDGGLVEAPRGILPVLGAEAGGLVALRLNEGVLAGNGHLCITIDGIGVIVIVSDADTGALFRMGVNLAAGDADCAVLGRDARAIVANAVGVHRAAADGDLCVFAEEMDAHIVFIGSRTKKGLI